MSGRDVPSAGEPRVLTGWSLFGATALTLVAAGIGRTAGGAAVVTLVPRGVAPEADGLALATGIVAGSVFGGLALALSIRSRAPRRYLALARPSGASVAVGVLGAAAIVLAFDVARRVTTGSLVPEGWPALAHSAPLPLLLLALCVAAPLFEESFFRGFLHASLRETRLGTPGTIAVTSLLFALAHGPTDALSFAEPLLSALFLSALRERSRSIAPGVLAHALGNLQAIVVALVIR